MDTYWDLPEKNRAALSREQVAAFIDAELMTKGVLKPAPLVLLDTTEPTLPTETLYVVEIGSFDAIDVAFPTPDAARAFLASGARIIGTSWQTGSAKFTRPIGSDARIVERQLPNAAAVDGAKSRLKEIASAKDTNEAMRREYDAASNAVDGVLHGLWEDWHRCCAKDAEMRRVASVFGDYVQTAGGNHNIAAGFLRKVFVEEKIRAATEWTGVDMAPWDEPALDVAAAE